MSELICRFCHWRSAESDLDSTTLNEVEADGECPECGKIDAVAEKITEEEREGGS